jgi:2-polyprenyl-3-methyl-5-hydroxy-6-metoxy-1,4-benzoquinol methylase
VASDAEKIEELTEIIQTVRDRVRSRYPRDSGLDTSSNPAIRIALADLMPLVHARDAAQARIASIGSVNPREGGIVNKAIQLLKKIVARSLRWFVRDQVVFNREIVAAIEAVMEALSDHNRILLSLASQANEKLGYLSAELTARNAELTTQLREANDISRHWIEWRAEWEHKLAVNEIQFLRSVADLQGAFQHRVTLMENGYRESLNSQHADYLGALERSSLDIQKRLWGDLDKIRGDYERLIHTELRLIRQRKDFHGPTAAAPVSVRPETPPPAPVIGFDYARFAERFRGSEEFVRRNAEFYKPWFSGLSSVLDIGCGRGEFLEAAREWGASARGIDIDDESITHCRLRGLEAEAADLFSYLGAQPEDEFDGIMSSQVVEHLPPEKLSEMVRLCASRLRRGGVLAIETPNPECLAIFATHFYLDPTHTRPVPHPLMSFYMEEAGLGEIKLHRLSPALDSIPEIAELPTGFRDRFFGGLDYALIGRKL